MLDAQPAGRRDRLVQLDAREGGRDLGLLFPPAAIAVVHQDAVGGDAHAGFLARAAAHPDKGGPEGERIETEKPRDRPGAHGHEDQAGEHAHHKGQPHDQQEGPPAQ